MSRATGKETMIFAVLVPCSKITETKMRKVEDFIVKNKFTYLYVCIYTYV